MSDFVPTLEMETVYLGPMPRVSEARLRRIAPTGDRVRYVYVLASEDRILYVGKAANLFWRLRNHRKKPWWPSVTRLVLLRRVSDDRHHADAEIVELEREAIADLQPSENIIRTAPVRDLRSVTS